MGLFQFGEMMILPLTFSGRGPFCISRVGSIPYSSSSVHSSCGSMSRNMGRCQRVAGGTGSGAGRRIIVHIPGSCMSIEGSSAHFGHPEHTGPRPFPARFYSCAGTTIIRVFFLKVWQCTLCTVSSPDC